MRSIDEQASAGGRRHAGRVAIMRLAVNDAESALWPMRMKSRNMAPHAVTYVINLFYYYVNIMSWPGQSAIYSTPPAEHAAAAIGSKRLMPADLERCCCRFGHARDQ